MQKPLLVELEAFHDDCYAINAQERFKDVRMLTMPGMAVNARTMTFYSKVSGPETLKAIEFIRREPHVKHLQVIYKDRDRAFLELQFDKKHSSIYSCMEAGALLDKPALTQGRLDFLPLIFRNGKDFKEFAGKVRDKFDFKLKSKIVVDAKAVDGLGSLSACGAAELKTVSASLSDAQRTAFDLAVQRGYYDHPQRTTVAELSARAGLAPSTYGEHLRKAESKLLPVVGQLIKYL
ncbi:MAG: helix-turn-helix domain-containing protein [Candidatus Diapherotrites archaeon]|uniref:Helix-turn-helix domain-containing protein n=1 Tax=Candidatus Iainarchaeum sp. TaxID=3101447 RepID=A0A8T4L6V0_9ARCH|nr:helix-turn-helix domain-containing protein [Candidatus Diapherotrites archaeon]